MHPMTSHKWAISRVDLVNFLHQAPTNAKDTGGKQFKENPPRIDRSEFATIVRPQQKQLENWVLSKPSGTQLDPADIYKKSLEINSGNPFLARLTVHNLMKDVTASSRNAGSSTPQIRERDSRIESRLLNLREKNDPNYSSDKMGPWYHMFGIAVADAAMLGGGRLADMVTPSNDRGKNSTDAWSVDAFSHKGK
ncbi:MAG: hypothetical protein VKP72_00930 [bacterium]|nr:hypothetical protein [bacterium]